MLIVPRRGGTTGDVNSHLAENAQLNLAPEVITRRTVIRAGKHDTVTSVATRYKLSAAQVADWNHLSASAAFHPGQQVVLHLPIRTVARAPVRVNGRNVKQVANKPAARATAKPVPRKPTVQAQKRH